MSRYYQFGKIAQKNKPHTLGNGSNGLKRTNPLFCLFYQTIQGYTRRKI